MNAQKLNTPTAGIELVIIIIKLYVLVLTDLLLLTYTKMKIIKVNFLEFFNQIKRPRTNCHHCVWCVENNKYKVNIVIIMVNAHARI